MKKSIQRVLALCLVLVLAFSALPIVAQTAENGYEESGYTENEEFALPEPEFEVAFLLDPARVLDEYGNFILEYRELLLGGGGSAQTNDLPGRERRLNIQWLDTPAQDFSAEGWINRIRHRHWQSPTPYQLTYRTRIPLWPVTSENIEAAFMEAIEAGFCLEDWDFEIDWSYNSAVLSITISAPQLEEVGGAVYPLGLPNDEYSRTLLIENAPVDDLYAVGGQELVDWYIYNLAYVVIHGPVYYRRYDNRSPVGLDIPGHLTIEVMPLVGTDEVEFIVEASFNSTGLEATTAARDALQELLEYHGLLLHRSGLRTSTVLARYAREVYVEDANDDEAFDDEYEYEVYVEAPEVPTPVVSRWNMTVGAQEIFDAYQAVVSVMDVVPGVHNGVVMVPIYFVTNVLGGSASWDGATSTVSLSYDGRNIDFVIGEVAYGMDVPALLINSRTFVSLQFVVEFFDTVVTFDYESGAIEVVTIRGQ